MKSYAIEIFFDDEFSQYIEGLWEQYHNQQLSSFMFKVQGTEPHIALAVYDNIEEHRIRETFHTFIQKEIYEFELHFDAVAFFPTTKVTFFQPNVKPELYELMIQTHHFFQTFIHNCSPFYSLARWFPHVTIGKNVTIEEGQQTVSALASQFTPKIAKVTRLVLVEIEHINQQVICRTLECKELLKSNYSKQNDHIGEPK